jgi:hypothetical protein
MTLRAIGRRAFRYTAIATIAFVALVIFVVLASRAKIPLPSDAWIFLAVFTGGLFWTTAKTSREYWSRPRFWLAMAGLLGVHLLVFIPVLRVYPEWRPIWFVPILIVEAGSFGAILFLLFGRHKVR